MNILLCGASMGIGGAETHVLSLALALSERGHRVTVAAERGELCGELKRRGIRFIRVPLAGGGARDATKSYSILRRILRRWDFDVVHAHSRLSSLIVSLVRRKEGLGFRFIVTAHAKYKTTRALRLFSVWGDRCIAVSRDIKEHLVKNYDVDSRRITVIPNGIDTKRFAPAHKDDRQSVLFVSRLDKDCSRGAKLLCRIAPELSKSFPKSRITIAGGGDDYDAVYTLSQKINRAVGREYVYMAGKCADMPALIGKHACVVGVSRVALEAMSMEKPVILFGNEGTLGLLNGKKLSMAINTNFTCRGCGKSKNGRFLLSEIRKTFVMDDKKRRALSRFCRRVVVEGYSLERMTDMTLAVYNAKKRSAPRIAVGGYYGFGNLGDDSVLSSITGELKRLLPECRLTVFTKGGKAVAGIGGVSFADRISPVSVLKCLLNSDVYISGGGSLLQNRTSLRSLAYYCGMLRLANKTGNTCVILSNGIGPLHGKLAEKMAVEGLRSADYVSVRDMDSFLKVISLTRGEVLPELSADPTFISPEENKTADKKNGKTLLECGVRYVAVALNGKQGKANEALVRSIGEYCRKHRLLPVFVSMDARIDESYARYGAKVSRGVAMKAAVASDVRAILKNAELAIGSRLHFLIFSLCEGTPFVPVSADPKVDSFSLEIFGSPALNVREGDEPVRILKKLERFISENHISFDGEARRLALEVLSLRAKGDMRRISKLCLGVLKENSAKTLEKNALICYN